MGGIRMSRVFAVDRAPPPAEDAAMHRFFVRVALWSAPLLAAACGSSPAIHETASLPEVEEVSAPAEVLPSGPCVGGQLEFADVQRMCTEGNPPPPVEGTLRFELEPGPPVLAARPGLLRGRIVNTSAAPVLVRVVPRLVSESHLVNAQGEEVLHRVHPNGRFGALVFNASPPANCVVTLLPQGSIGFEFPIDLRPRTEVCLGGRCMSSMGSPPPPGAYELTVFVDEFGPAPLRASRTLVVR